MTIPVPDANHDDEPTTCVRINDLWIPVVLGALQAFLNPPQWGIDQNVFMINPEPIWDGDEESQFLAEQQVLAIMDALMLGNCLEEDEMPVASVVSYAGTTAPTGWLLCDGASHLKADYAALWAVLSESGAIFEEDSTHFIVPDLRGRMAIGAGAGAGLTARSIGQFDGHETHLLEVNQLPAHDHKSAFQSQEMGIGSEELANLGVFSPESAEMTSLTGSDEPHNNMPPFFVLNYIIKT